MRDPHSAVDDDAPDDIDRLFAGLDRAAVPEDLTARVLARTVDRSETTRAVLAWPWMLAVLAALGALALAGYQLGASLATSDGLELLAAILGDVGLLETAPGDVLVALSDIVPWTLLALAGLSAGFLVLAAGHVVSRGPASPRARRPV